MYQAEYQLPFVPHVLYLGYIGCNHTSMVHTTSPIRLFSTSVVGNQKCALPPPTGVECESITISDTKRWTNCYSSAVKSCNSKYFSGASTRTYIFCDFTFHLCSTLHNHGNASPAFGRALGGYHTLPIQIKYLNIHNLFDRDPWPTMVMHRRNRINIRKKSPSKSVCFG